MHLQQQTLDPNALVAGANNNNTSTKIRLNFSSAIAPLPSVIPSAVEDDADLEGDGDYDDEESLEDEIVEDGQ